MTDAPFEDLGLPLEAQTPRASFVRSLRRDLLAALDLTEDDLTADGVAARDRPVDVPLVDLPDRRTTMPTTTDTPPPTTPATVVVPYLTLSDASAAIDWYAEAFGAVEEFRVVGDDGAVGHAEIRIGEARFMLSDEFPDMDVVSPTTLGGTSTALHLTVPDVDAVYARAVGAGAAALSEPEDQPHGSRHGTLLDPSGHRWMLSQDLETFDLDTYRDRTAASEDWEVRPGEAADTPTTSPGAIWAVVTYEDFAYGRDLLTRVFGFDEAIVVFDPEDAAQVAHSQFVAPAGGVLQLATVQSDNPYLLPPGAQRLYVVTPDPQEIWDRCGAERGLEVVQAPYEPPYAPGTMGFGVRDREGNVYSFGSYAGEA